MGTLSVLLQLLSLACLALSNVIAYDYNVMIVPQSPVVEIGKNFTATCMLINTSAATADDLYWSIRSPWALPKEQYTKINDSAINITVTITRETPGWLFCKCKSSSPDVMMNEGKFTYGILLKKGYPPEKPENLSCVAAQSGKQISNILSCTWEPGKRGSGELDTNYSLFANVNAENYPVSVVAKQNNGGQITLPVIFPHHMDLEIWVIAENDLGTVQSEHLVADANRFVKTNPPSNVKVISEENFAISLLMSWTRPIGQTAVSLIYHIRFCAAGSGTWTEVPLEDVARDIQSFRLQYLKPDTDYIIQVRCKHYHEDSVYWSEWSRNTTAKTPEDAPKGKPDLWRIITPTEGKKERTVQVICKDPLLSNGKIRSFDIRIQAGEWESVNTSEPDPRSTGRRITTLRQIDLADRKMAYVEVIACNSVGKSLKTLLVIPKTGHERQPVRELKWSSQGGQLCLEWQPPNVTATGDPHRDTVTEYVVEWVSLSDLQMDWQRERANTTRTAIRGTLEKFKRYNVSVYPLYSGWTGKPVTTAAYLEQGVPLEAPSVRLDGKPGRNEAMLVWKEIPLQQRRGFIANYTIFYSAEGKEYAIPVSADTHSYALKSLSSNTKYVAWIMASTIRGSVNGTEHSFSTSKYAPGQIEGIVVGVCLGFLFFVMLTMFLCIYKKDSIKKNFWPQIPNPGNSSIGAWSPDLPSKADTPKENAMADVSVVEVDVFDGKSVFEEDKACLPLKKDKYLSEEHSSGIGGSSCMSSPRQSVSDSDEGGDSGQTTGSTVQYSSVVASNGYKGQTPGSLPQPQQHSFARSESTQPLLDSEENPDVPLGPEGGGQSHRFPRKPYFRRSPGNEGDATELSQLESEEQGGLVSLRFCPLEEGSQQTTPTEEGQSPDRQPDAPVSSYRPQLSGYRPQ